MVQTAAKALVNKKRRVLSRSLWLASTLLLSTALLFAIMKVSNASPSGMASSAALETAIIDPELQEIIDLGIPEEEIGFIIYLRQKVSFQGSELPADKKDRRIVVVNALKREAESSQEPLIVQLQLLQNQALVSNYRVLWIVNGIQVKAKASTVPALSQLPGVERIVLDKSILLLDQENQTLIEPPSGPTWGLQRVRADQVWDHFGIMGSGITIGFMDTGVDWTHPALQQQYRGLHEDQETNHEGNWFDAVDGSLEPFDPEGHGTHVAGTAVGLSGIGMAPGAQWIAVRVLNEFGYGSIGDIHAGFQWVMAPNDDPSLAPDILNNSWGGAGDLPDFYPDIVALKSAGIVPVFSAGNSGPGAGTINAPAAYTETLAVGAVDETGSTTWFSARGPSSFTSDPKPTIVAPGAFVISAKPGGEYAVRDGTSMSAPHVSGLLALLLSGEENLSEVDLARIITSSAKALDQPIPSSESGWGRIDAFDAVAAIMPTGRVEGNVSGSTGVIPNASVTITPPAGTSITITTDSAGNYSIHLLPGSYQVEAGVFGFEAEVIDSVLVITDEVTRVDFELDRMPFGTVHGSVTDSSTRAVSETVIEVSGTPLSVATNQLGEYSISIPSGSYTLTARSTGYFIRRLGVQIDASSNIDLDFHLDAAAKALLVDSGAWYYRSQIDFYTSALDEYGLAYDTLSIRNPYNDVPGSEDLADYEIVLWSSPTDSPVALSAGEVISNYLGHGGNLLISGQNVAEYDDELIFERSWWSYHFGASYIGSKTPPITIAGYPESLFDPQPILLNEPGSAGNQEATDVMAIDAGSFSEPAFQYQDGSIAALQAGSCAPFEAISLGFGLEGVASVEQRARIIADSMEYFSRPDREVGVRLIPNEQPHLVAPGYSVTMTFQVLNRSEIFTDTFSFFVEDNIWPVQVLSKTHTLGSCQWGTITATVDVPSGLASDTREKFTIRAVSMLDPHFDDSLEIQLKTPGRLLLVDDHRWYDRQEVYRSALDANGYVYDIWETGSFESGLGSPPSQLLNEYAIVIWYTGYDWYAPVTDEEEESLETFLNLGGRLFLSSQDFLYRHEDSALAREYFGIRSYRESVTPTVVYGSDSPTFPEVITHPIPLDYGPYQNFSDGLISNGNAQAALWNDSGYSGGLSNSGDSWRTVFWAVPFEAIPEEMRSAAINRIVGWLGNLGPSVIDVDRNILPNSADANLENSYTITLKAVDNGESNSVWITNTVPPELSIDLSSISGDAEYDQLTRELTWHGIITGGEEHEIGYRAFLDDQVGEGDLVSNQVQIYYQEDQLQFERTAPLWIGTADYSASGFAANPTIANIGDLIEYELGVVNNALHPHLMNAVIHIPPDFSLVTDTISSSAGSINSSGNTITWTAGSDTGVPISAAYLVTAPLLSVAQSIPTLVVLSDGLSNLTLLHEYVFLVPHQLYLPSIANEN